MHYSGKDGHAAIFFDNFMHEKVRLPSLSFRAREVLLCGDRKKEREEKRRSLPGAFSCVQSKPIS